MFKNGQRVKTTRLWLEEQNIGPQRGVVAGRKPKTLGANGLVKVQIDGHKWAGTYSVDYWEPEGIAAEPAQVG